MGCGLYCTAGNSYTHFFFTFGINWRLHLHRGRLEIIYKCNMLHRGRLEIIYKCNMLHRGRLEIIYKCNMLHRGRLEISNDLISYTACCFDPSDF